MTCLVMCTRRLTCGSLNQLFAGIPLTCIAPPPRVFDGVATTPLSEVVELLNETGVLAVPVRNPEAGPADAWRAKYLGTAASVCRVLASLQLVRCPLACGWCWLGSAGVGCGRDCLATTFRCTAVGQWGSASRERRGLC